MVLAPALTARLAAVSRKLCGVSWAGPTARTAGSRTSRRKLPLSSSSPWLLVNQDPRRLRGDKATALVRDQARDGHRASPMRLRADDLSLRGAVRKVLHDVEPCPFEVDAPDAQGSCLAPSHARVPEHEDQGPTLSAAPAALLGKHGELGVGEEPLFALARAGTLHLRGDVAAQAPVKDGRRRLGTKVTPSTDTAGDTWTPAAASRSRWSPARAPPRRCPGSWTPW